MFPKPKEVQGVDNFNFKHMFLISILNSLHQLNAQYSII